MPNHLSNPLVPRPVSALDGAGIRPRRAADREAGDAPEAAHAFDMAVCTVSALGLAAMIGVLMAWRGDVCSLSGLLMFCVCAIRRLGKSGGTCEHEAQHVVTVLRGAPGVFVGAGLIVLSVVIQGVGR